MSKENIIERLASFDFTSPVQVNVIFEDDEDQSLSPEVDVKKEKTTIDKDYTKSEEIFSKSKRNEYSTEYTNVQDGEKMVEPQNSFTADFNQTSTRTSPIEGVKKSECCTLNDDLNNNKNLKRKLDEESFYGAKISKTTTKIDNDPDSNIFQRKQIVSNHQTTFKMQEEPPNTANNSVNADYSSNTEMTCITNLLKSVSDHLIHILNAYNKFMQVKENKATNPLEKEKNVQNFKRIKYHYFNLSFCTVDNIILPQEKNILFTGQFLNDTVRLAGQKNRALCLETQIAPLFFELLKWCKQKKLDINNTPIETYNNTGQTQNNPLLRHHLALPSKTVNVSNTGTASLSNRFVNTGQPKLQQNQINFQNEIIGCGTGEFENVNRFISTTYLTQHQRLPSKPINVANEGTNLLADINRSTSQHLRLPANPESVPNESNGLPNNLNSFLNTYSEYLNRTNFPSTPQRNNYMQNTYYKSPPKMHQAVNVLQDPSKKIQTQTATNNYFPATNNTENSKSVVFSSGPPGRKVSITVEQSFLETCSNDTMTNTTAASKNCLWNDSIQDHIGKLTSPPTCQATIQNRQNAIQSGQFYKQQIHQIPQQSSANNYLKGNVPQGYQSNVPQAWPQGYQSTVTKAPCSWQKTTNDYYRSVEVQQAVQTQPFQIQIEQQNPDMTRSISTDSGFMSPLHFNNFSESNKEGVEDNQLPSPMITHITSLNPEASYIVEGLCFVCGKSTRKMCVGCYKRYYCSHPCQRFDWHIHKDTCTRSVP